MCKYVTFIFLTQKKKIGILKKELLGKVWFFKYITI